VHFQKIEKVLSSPERISPGCAGGSRLLSNPKLLGIVDRQTARSRDITWINGKGPRPEDGGRLRHALAALTVTLTALFCE
jgi:hypothetical protein